MGVRNNYSFKKAVHIHGRRFFAAQTIITLAYIKNIDTKTKHTKKLTCYQYFQYTVIEQYLQLVGDEGLKRMEASEQVADSLTPVPN
jgi:hypothetical protein